MRTRRAVSLVELLMIMSTCTIVLTLTGVLLQRAMKIQMQSRGVAKAERTAVRLAAQFRNDVHFASDAAVGKSAENHDALLRLELEGDRSIVYSRLPGVVVRLESGNGKPTWREEFVVPAGNELTIEDKDSPQRLVLTINPKSKNQQAVSGNSLVSTSPTPMYMQVEAFVGQHLRFQGARVAQGETE